MDGWKIQELRAAVLSDLHEFIPRGYYRNVRKDEDMASNDFMLAHRLRVEQYKDPKFTPRQLAAVWLLDKIGKYCLPYTSPGPAVDAAEGITPEDIKETTLEHLQNALRRYVAHLGAEEARALMPGNYGHPSNPLSAVDTPVPKRISVSKQQEEAILDWLKLNNYDAHKLPVPPQGGAGVKAECRGILSARPTTLFLSKKTFDTTWQRLRDNENIKDEEKY